MRSDPDKKPSRGRAFDPASEDPIESGAGAADPEASEYKVGKGRPPLHSRFKSGGKGGPGRPKGSKNRATMFREALDTPRPVTVEGRKRRMSPQELGYHQLARQVAKGDRKAIELTEKIRNSLCGPDEAGEAITPPLTPAELAILGRRAHD